MKEFLSEGYLSLAGLHRGDQKDIVEYKHSGTDTLLSHPIILNNIYSGLRQKGFERYYVGVSGRNFITKSGEGGSNFI